ncbi:MAG: hypothetical protein QOE51_2989, partial [Actinoplanes sp.]|nr:hypothetical protein [Actinoplanes sp.]
HDSPGCLHRVAVAQHPPLKVHPSIIARARRRRETKDVAVVDRGLGRGGVSGEVVSCDWANRSSEAQGVPSPHGEGRW